MEAVSIKWACVPLSAASHFGVFCVGVICGVIDVFGRITNVFVVVVDDLFSTFHAAVIDFDCVTIINNFSKFAVFWEVLDYWGKESVSNIGADILLNRGLYQSMLFCCLSFHLLVVGGL